MVENGTLSQQSAVLEAYHGNEETYARRYAVLQRGGKHLKDELAHVAHADSDEQQALNKDCRQGELPGIAQRQAYRLNEENIQSQSRCLSERTLGNESHEQRAHDGPKSGDCENGFYGKPLAAQRCKHNWHEGQDIDHRDEGGET